MEKSYVPTNEDKGEVFNQFITQLAQAIKSDPTDARKKSVMNRTASLRKLAAKEAAIGRLLLSESGLRKIAANMANFTIGFAPSVMEDIRTWRIAGTSDYRVGTVKDNQQPSLSNQEGSETMHQAPVMGEDIVRPVQKCTELNRNDLASYIKIRSNNYYTIFKPVREQLDYKGISRNFVVVNQLVFGHLAA